MSNRIKKRNVAQHVQNNQEKVTFRKNQQPRKQNEEYRIDHIPPELTDIKLPTNKQKQERPKKQK